ncbi:MAG TPA: hypothetical protein VN714_00195 [Trebonia sp.]|nr:hypothetical protein [Trebonia sp.]
MLDVLGRDSPRWAALVRGWATGDAADRARAATAIRHRWKDSVWRELVPGLLDAGLSEQSAANLREGILPINDVTDATGLSGRLDALRPLLDDPRPVVRQFAGEATQSLHSFLSLLGAPQIPGDVLMCAHLATEHNPTARHLIFYENNRLRRI